MAMMTNTISAIRITPMIIPAIWPPVMPEGVGFSCALESERDEISAHIYTIR